MGRAIQQSARWIRRDIGGIQGLPARSGDGEPAEGEFEQLMEHHLRMMASEDCVLSYRTSGPNYRTKQMASGDARDPSVTSQQIGTQSRKVL